MTCNNVFALCKTKQNNPPQKSCHCTVLQYHFLRQRIHKFFFDTVNLPSFKENFKGGMVQENYFIHSFMYLLRHLVNYLNPW